MQEISFGRYTSVLYRYIQIIINHRLKSYGFGSGQYLFFIAISKNPGINQKELSANMNIDKATTAKALSKLESLGYILRKKDEKDRRYYKIYLSEKGADFISVLREILSDITTTLSKGMTEDDMQKSKALFEKMIENAVNEVDNLR